MAPTSSFSKLAVKAASFLCLYLLLVSTPFAECRHSLRGVTFLNKGETITRYKSRIVTLRVSLHPHIQAAEGLRRELERIKLHIQETYGNGSMDHSYITQEYVRLLDDDLWDLERAFKDIKSVVLSPSTISESHVSGRMETFPMEGPILSTILKVLASKVNPGNAQFKPKLVMKRNANVENLLHHSIISSNDSLVEISRNKKALSAIANAVHCFEQGTVNMSSWNTSQTSNSTLTSINVEHINTVLSMTSKRLRRIIHSLERVRDGLQYSLGGHVSPLLLDEDQLSKILRKVRNQIGISHQNAWPFPEKRWDLFYQICPVALLPYGNYIIIVFVIPFLDDNLHKKLTLYEFLQVPVAADNHTAFVYDVDAAGIAVTPDHNYYALLTQQELDLCGYKTIQFCQFSSPLYSMIETPTCMSSLFKETRDLVEQQCELKRVQHDKPVAKYMFDNTWLVYSPHQWHMVTECTDDNVVTNATFSAGISTIDVEYECEASGVSFLLPARSRSEKDFVSNTRFDFRVGPLSISFT